MKDSGRLKFSGIPLIFKDCSFETFITTTVEQERVKDTCFNYADNFDELYKKGTSMILYGTPGTGKTHIGCSIVRHIIEKKEKTAKIITLSKAIRRIKSTWNRNGEETEQEAIDSFTKPDLLVLDEVGVQFGSNAEKMLLTEIINERYENIKSTIMISNLGITSLKEIIGERVIDRMRDNNGIGILFKWESYRGVT